jgi:hypothetical protein
VFRQQLNKSWNQNRMKYLKRQEGMILPLVVGLVALVAVVIGVAVWQSQKAKTEGIKATASPSPSVVAQASSAPTATATPAPANEIKVTELGFKMTLPAGLTGLKYAAQTNIPGSAEHPATYSTSTFSTTSLEQLAGAASQCSAANGSIGGIARYSEDPSTFTHGVPKKVGNFYLEFSTPPAPCSDAAGAGQLEASQTSLLRQALDSATAL